MTYKNFLIILLTLSLISLFSACVTANAQQITKENEVKKPLITDIIICSKETVTRINPSNKTQYMGIATSGRIYTIDMLSKGYIDKPKATSDKETWANIASSRCSENSIYCSSTPQWIKVDETCRIFKSELEAKQTIAKEKQEQVERERKAKEQAERERAKQKQLYEESVSKIGYGKWEIRHFVDDFKEKTKNKYIQIWDFNGEFSNSATSNSKCPAELIVTPKSVGIFLYEYDARRPATTFIGKGTVKIKNSQGEIFVSTVSDWSHRGGLSVDTAPPLIEFLKRSIGIVKVNVQDQYSSNYNFEFNANGFTNAFGKI